MVTAYTLDRNDRIVSVSSDWDDEALRNDGPSACSAHVVGGRLVDAIAGDPVRMFMTAILMRVRASGQPESVPYRCDGPTVKRSYVMELTPLPDGAVRVTHRLEREEPTDLVIRVRSAVDGRRSQRRCSICCRVEEGGAWVDPFDGGRNRDLRVVHAICEDCKKAPLRALRTRGAHAAAGPGALSSGSDRP